ncbi:MAG: hypothetical protein ACE5EC_06150 [Phycisphaerae bacterium]
MSTFPKPISIPDIDANEMLDTTAEGSVFAIINTPSEPTTQQGMRLIEISGSLDFWNDEDEDLYTADDGRPL